MNKAKGWRALTAGVGLGSTPESAACAPQLNVLLLVVSLPYIGLFPRSRA